jgi:uncharacterized protein YdaU (DUF1376 family)
MRAHEIGIYTMLLMEMYARGQALDLSEDRMARLCGADRRTFAKTLELLIAEGKIIKLDCGLWNERCENAFKERAKMQKQQILAGQTSAEKRNKIKGKKPRPLNARSTPVQPISEAQTLKKKEPYGASETALPASASPAGSFPALAVIEGGKPKADDAELYAYGRTVLGNSAGGLITKLKKLCNGDIDKTQEALAQAATKDRPVEWISAVLRGDETRPLTHEEIYPPEIYGSLR